MVSGRTETERRAIASHAMRLASRLRAEGDAEGADLALKTAVHRGVTPAELLDVYDQCLRELSTEMKRHAALSELDQGEPIARQEIRGDEQGS